MPSCENEVSAASGSRLTHFKNHGKNTEEMRRRRNEVTIELRKQRKDDQLSKRRNISDSEQLGSPLQESNSQSSASSMSVEEIMAGMLSGGDDARLLAVQAARKTLSREKSPPIDVMIAAGIVPKCVEFLAHSHNPSLQFESAWALTNIASGTQLQTNTVVKAGAVPKLIELLSSPYLHVAEQAVWAIGNIAGDGPELRDLVLGCDAMQPLLDLVKPNTSLRWASWVVDVEGRPPPSAINVLRNVVWCISNLCRHKSPPAPFDRVRVALPILYRILHSDDSDVLSDACWAVSYLTDGNNDKIQAVVDTGLVGRLVELLGAKEHTVVTPALRSVGNIVTGNDVQTDAVLQAGGLQHLLQLLRHERLNIVKEAAWTVSNILAGNVTQIQAVIDAGIFAPLIHVLDKGDFKSQKEAAWAVTNFTSGGNVDQMAVLIQHGVMGPFCNVLTAQDWKTIVVVLDGLNNFFQAAEKMGEVDRIAVIVEECGGLDKLEALQQHENETVYHKVSAMIDAYFSEAENEDPLANGPSTINGELNFNNAGGPAPDGGFSF